MSYFFPNRTVSPPRSLNPSGSGWPLVLNEIISDSDDVIVHERLPESQVSAKIKPPTPLPKPDDALLDTVEYEALCEELGYSPTEIVQNAVTRKLQAKRVPRYDAKEVSDYMASITPEGMHWGWVRLGDQSYKSAIEEMRQLQNRPSGFVTSINSFISSDFDVRSYNGTVIAGTYDKLIPIHILRRIKAVKELFVNDEPKFYVTDYAVPNPDPFVKVVLKNGVSVIFGVWDEPGFGDLKTEV